MIQTVTLVRHSRTRKSLMMSCASVALATTAVVPQMAHAQAFAGTPTTASGTVSYSRSTPGSETITIGSSSAIINWNPAGQEPGGGTLNFLPAGNTATFTTPGTTDFTVLNRIVPRYGQPIALNGHVISNLQGTGAIGGHVWFYAPGGIVVGATAVFDVGGLLLTTNNVTSFNTSPNGFNGRFSAPAGSTSSIQIQAGAQINAPQKNSYVALVAPRIEQGGKVRVNGSVAYAAGEQLAMTMNQGLFDIQVDVGTTDGNGIVHTGETSGPRNTTVADNHKIYMVAVPKNQALTMLLGGTVGFDDAVSASVENGQILLSSGWGVHDSDGSGQYYNVNRGLNSSIDIESGNYTSDLTAWGQGTLEANAQSADIHFTGDVEFNSWGGSGSSFTALTASNEHQLSVARDVRLLSSEPGSYASAQIDSYSGGVVTIGGLASLNAWDGANGADVRLQASGGSIRIAGPVSLSAPGNGGGPTGSQSAGSDSYGGTASVEASDGGRIATGDLSFDVSGSGQSNGEGGAAGSGYGGDIWITADGGTVTVNGTLTARASGTGGNAIGQAGQGSGGGIEVTSENGGSVNVSGLADLQATGTGGSGASAGGGAGGSIGLFGTGGSLAVNWLLLRANGTDTGGVIELGSDSDFSGNAGSLQFGSVDATANGGDNGGLISVTTGSGSSVDLGDAILTASGAFGGSISLVAGTCFECGDGESLTAQAATLPAGGGIAATNLAMNTTGSILVDLRDGADVSVSSDINGNAGQFITLFDDGSGGAIRAHSIELTSITLNDTAKIFANLINFTTAGDMFVANLNATDFMQLTAGADLNAADLTSGGQIRMTSGGDTSFGNILADDLDFEADGSATGGNIAATTRVTGNAQGALTLGDVSAGPNLPTNDDFSVALSSPTSITVDNVSGAGHVGFATLGDLSTGNVTAGDLAMMLVGGNISTGAITTSSTGRVYIADASMFITGGGAEGEFDKDIVLGLAPVPTGGNITIGGPVTTDRLQAAAGGTLSLGDTTAQTDIGLFAGGLASFNGVVGSPTITVTSSDIDIASGATLGVNGLTNLVTLNAVSNGQPIVLGNGPAAPGQYHLGAEGGDVHATSVVINAQGAAPDFQVFDANIDGSGTNGGGVTNLTLNTTGSVFVNGHVNWANAGASDTLTFNAGDLIGVNTDTGGIQMTNSAGSLAGILALNANNVWVGSGSLLSQLATNVNFPGRDAALATNSGTPNQQGFVRAAAITGNVANTFFVQNSGTPQLFAGIDTGAGGLSVNSTGTTPAILIIYGRQTTASGTVLTNLDFLGSVNVGGTGGFTPDSSVNGCEIGSAASCGTPSFFFDNSSLLGPLSKDDEDKKKDQDQAEGDARVDPTQRLINTAPINLDHTINDPVTSGGDVIMGGPVTPN